MTENGNKLTAIHTILAIAIGVVCSCVMAHAGSTCGSCKDEVGVVWYEQGGERFHEECLTESSIPHCLVCGKGLTKAHYTDGLGGYVCLEHLVQVKRCYSCQRFMKIEKSADLSLSAASYSVCPICARTAVNELAKAKRLWREVSDQLARSGINILPDVQLTLVDRDELLEHTNGTARHPLGATLYRSDLTRSGDHVYRDFRVLVLSGLPEAQLKEVLAHELMHVWMMSHTDERHALAVSEGSCQFAAYLVLSEDQSEQGRFYLEQLLTNDDPIYGEGLRQVMRIVEREGTAGWLDYLKNESGGSSRASKD